MGKREKDKGREREAQAEETLAIKDRRRFAADGSRRTDDIIEGSRDEGDAAAAEVLERREDVVPASVATELEERAQAAESRLAEFSAAFQKYKDEHEAIRGRLERDQDVRVREVLSRTFLKILDALDNLDRSLEHAEEGPLTEGVRLVHRQFLDLLKSEGVERLEVVGEPFDPELAEAVVVTPVEDESDRGRVVEELRPGYVFEGLVIRPAQVRVGQKE